MVCGSDLTAPAVVQRGAFAVCGAVVEHVVEFALVQFAQNVHVEVRLAETGVLAHEVVKVLERTRTVQH